MSALKDIYSPSFYNHLSLAIEKAYPGFERKDFLKKIKGGGFESMELKERMHHTTKVLHEFFPGNFGKSFALIKKIIHTLQKEKTGEDNLAYIFLPDYIESYGLKEFDLAAEAFECITQFISCEFAVRPFIILYKKKMIGKMVEWSKHENARVRRLSTEGCRPRLPWAMALPELKQDPSPILPILENLKNDPSDTVRRSVANNLNDISKDNPDVVLKIAASWKGQSKETDAIIKHGCRTLLKAGHAEVLAHFNLHSQNIKVDQLRLSNAKIKIGESLSFSFRVSNNNPDKKVLRLEYAIDYQKKKGHLARKVYKISERNFQAGETALISRKQKFILITTRTFHAGKHRLAIIVNGKEFASKDFDLAL